MRPTNSTSSISYAIAHWKFGLGIVVALVGLSVSGASAISFVTALEIEDTAIGERIDVMQTMLHQRIESEDNAIHRRINLVELAISKNTLETNKVFIELQVTIKGSELSVLRRAESHAVLTPREDARKDVLERDLAALAIALQQAKSALNAY